MNIIKEEERGRLGEERLYCGKCVLLLLFVCVMALAHDVREEGALATNSFVCVLT